MARSTGKTLTIYLAADLKNFNRGINKAETGLKGLGNSLSKYLGPALIASAAAAGAFALKVGVDAVKAASDLIETQNKVGEIFGQSTQAILDFAQTSVTALGQTEEQVLEASATFAQFGKAAGLADGDLVNFSTDLVTLASDLASFNNSTPEEAIDALGSALRGSNKPLRRFGVLLDDASLREEALALGISDGTSQLTAQQKVLAASAAIFEQTTDAQGDFLRTSEGLANTTRILTAAVNDAKAEIGMGLVFAIEEATSAMGGSQGMAEIIGQVGQEIGLLTKGVGLAIGEIIEFKDAFNDLNTDAKVTGTSIKVTDAAMVGLRASVAFASLGLSEIGMQFRNGALEADEYKKKIDGVHDSFIGLAQAERAGRIEARIAQEQMITGARDSGISAAQLQKREAALAPYLARRAALLEDVTTTTGRATDAVEKLTNWELKAIKSQDKLSESLKLTESDLDGAIAKFYEAGDAVRDYATAIQGDLLGGIDLGAAFTGQLDEAGKASGIGLVDAFNQQIEQAKWFGNVLTSIKNSGADATLIKAIASLGPETGGALGQQLIDDGLIPTMNDKWTAVQDVTAGLAMGLVPEFLIAGVASAQDMVTGLATQLKAEQKTLKKLGKNMAKPVGAAFKSRLARDVAEAVRNVEASATAARAERVAQATVTQQALTDQAVATAISNVLRRSDARAGSAVQPVLT